MTTVYVVTSGAYSQYGIDCIFSTRELAEAWIRHVESQDGAKPFEVARDHQVEEYDLDDGSQPFPSAFVAEIDEDGEFHRITPEHPFFGKHANDPKSIYSLAPSLPYWSYSHRATDPPGVEIDHWGWRTFKGYGKTAEHARRSAEELRRQTLALEGKVVTGASLS